jgi:ABC-2 type transport system ATP-binding protein
METRDLIRGLAGDHTIILSTHILPEVEAMCERVIIIAKGKLVATDTVAHLTSRLHGSEMVSVEVAPRSPGSDGQVFLTQVQQKLEQVAGVSRVLHKESKDSRERFTVESLQGRQIRPELARAIIESGWNLNELRSVGLSLEEIFLQLTTEHKPDDAIAAEAPALIETTPSSGSSTSGSSTGESQ